MNVFAVFAKTDYQAFLRGGGGGEEESIFPFLSLPPPSPPRSPKSLIPRLCLLKKIAINYYYF